MPLPAKENRLSRTPIREEVYNRLLEWILKGALQPGEKIVDKELARHMGVSRTPVREALRRLEDRGLVESSANRWTRVAKIPPKEAEMIYPILGALERLALAMAYPSMGEKDFRAMELANLELQAAIEEGDPVAAAQADQRLHDIFLEASKNIHLIRIVRDLKIKSRRLEVNYFEGLSIADSSVAEHQILIAALRAGDPGSAETIILSNWERSLKRHRAVEKGRHP